MATIDRTRTAGGVYSGPSSGFSPSVSAGSATASAPGVQPFLSSRQLENSQRIDEGLGDRGTGIHRGFLAGHGHQQTNLIFPPVTTSDLGPGRLRPGWPGLHRGLRSWCWPGWPGLHRGLRSRCWPGWPGLYRRLHRGGWAGHTGGRRDARRFRGRDGAGHAAECRITRWPIPNLKPSPIHRHHRQVWGMSHRRGELLHHR